LSPEELLEHLTTVAEEIQRGKRFHLMADIWWGVFAASLTLFGVARGVRKDDRRGRGEGAEPSCAADAAGCSDGRGDG
jgi:hypothetical protein